LSELWIYMRLIVNRNERGPYGWQRWCLTYIHYIRQIYSERPRVVISMASSAAAVAREWSLRARPLVIGRPFGKPPRAALRSLLRKRAVRRARLRRAFATKDDLHRDRSLGENKGLDRSTETPRSKKLELVE
jgi:hypothetical protein